MTRPKQIVMHCPCGRPKVLAKGLCSTCYTLKRQDEAYYGGHREEVLKRDDYRCRVPGCATLKRGKRSVAVHHREPGNSDPAKMLTLCLSCHAKVTRTFYLQDDWPEFLRVLWREQHPDGHEQSALNFITASPLAQNVPLFEGMESMKLKGDKAQGRRRLPGDETYTGLQSGYFHEDTILPRCGVRTRPWKVVVLVK